MTLEEALAAHPDFDPEHVKNAYLNAVGLVNEGVLAEMPAPSILPTAQTEEDAISIGNSSEVQQSDSSRSRRRKPIDKEPGDSAGAEGPAV